MSIPRLTKCGRRLLCVCLVLIGFLSARSCWAAVEPMENRFLFVVETSASMSHSAEAVQKAIAGILGSEMQGQLRAGDTVGLWTYNDSLNTAFPMQVWSSAQKKNIIDTISASLGSIRYAKKGRLDRVWPSVMSVVKESRTLTVIFIYDGTELIQGTRFDSEINDLQKDYQRELRSADLPFVTVLAARNGEFFEYTVNSPSGTIRIPNTAEPVKKPEPTTAKATNAPPAKPREIRRVVIAPRSTNATPAAAPSSPRPTPTLPAPIPIDTPAPAPEPAPTIPSNPPVVAAFTPVITPASAQATPVEPPAPNVEAEPSKPALTTPEQTEDKPALPATTPQVAEPKISMALALAAACTLLAIAIGVIAYLLHSISRRDRSSLITQSMKRDGGR